MALRGNIEYTDIGTSEWGFPLYPTEFSPGSPTQENSRSEYYLYSQNRPSRTHRRWTWKVKDAGGWSEILKGAKRISYRTRKKRAQRKLATFTNFSKLPPEIR